MLKALEAKSRERFQTREGMILSCNKEVRSEDASGGFTGIGTTGPKSTVSIHHLELLGNMRSKSGAGARRLYLVKSD